MTVNRDIVKDEGYLNHRLVVETFWSLEEFYEGAVRGAIPGNTRISPDTGKKVREGLTRKLPTVLDIAEQAVQASTEVKELAAYVPELDVCGDVIDMGRYLTGEPECMISSPLRTTVKAGRVITLVSTADGNAGGDWLARGIMATALALALAKLGYETEMWADNYGTSTVNQYQRILIKGTADEIDPARLMFGFGDPVMLHELAFGNFDAWGKMGEQYSEFYRRYSVRGRGAAEYRNEFIESMYPEGTVFLSGYLGAGASPLMHAKAVEDQLRGLGILPESE